jgi:hypothetical protein
MNSMFKYERVNEATQQRRPQAPIIAYLCDALQPDGRVEALRNLHTLATM